MITCTLIDLKDTQTVEEMRQVLDSDDFDFKFQIGLSNSVNLSKFAILQLKDIKDEIKSFEGNFINILEFSAGSPYPPPTGFIPKPTLFF